jgi:hypothetical protein
MAQEPERGPTPVPKTILPAQPVVVPMTFHEAQPVMEVKLNGQGPFKFLFDTGAGGHGRISNELANKLGLKEAGEVVAGDPSGHNRQTIKTVAVDSLSIGEAEFRGLELMRRENRKVVDQQRGIDGILGFGLFGDCLITLDYPGKRFIIQKGQLSPGESMPFRDENGVPEITINVGGVDVGADVDSGSMGRLAIPQSVAQKLKFKREPKVVGKAATGFNEFEIREAPLDGVIQLGDQTLKDASLEIFDIFPRANIGGQFLRNYAVAIDLPNKRIRFSPSSQPAQEQPKYRVGIMMRRDAGESLVDDVVPGSPAEKAGLKAGDRITRINGIPMEDVDQDRLGRLFGSPEPLRLTIVRGENTIELTVTPARVGE